MTKMLEQAIVQLEAAIEFRNVELVKGMVKLLDMNATHTFIITKLSSLYTQDFIKDRLREAETLRDQRDGLGS